MPSKKGRGFTLIELLLVVMIISLLAVAVFVSLNPTKRINDTKNASRSQDVTTILSAIHSSIVDNIGELPSKLAATTVGKEYHLGTATTGCTIATGGCNVTGDTDCLDLMTTVGAARNLSTYLASMPIDPSGSPTYTSALTGYDVSVSTNGIVTVKSCGASGTTIAVSR